MALVPVDRAIRALVYGRAQRTASTAPFNRPARDAAERVAERIAAAADNPHVWLCGRCQTAHLAVARGRDRLRVVNRRQEVTPDTPVAVR